MYGIVINLHLMYLRQITVSTEKMQIRILFISRLTAVMSTDLLQKFLTHSKRKM